MKKVFVLISCIFITCCVFAQNYYEIPYVGKRSKLNKLSAEEETAFIKENSIKRIYDSFFTTKDDNVLSNYSIPAELTNVFKEEIPDEKGNYKLVVYRVMYSLKQTTSCNLNENDDTERKCIGQIIYLPLDGKYKQYEKYVYYGNELFQFGRMSSIGVEANNVQFRICGDNLFSFYTRLSYELWSHGYDEETLRYESEKISENSICRTKLNNAMTKTKICEVKADFPLIDKNNPFKYSVQNAYDGDPSTSYVEDTTNDLFEINIDFMNYSGMEKIQIIDEIKIINGYAASKELYQKNNRIKSIQYDWKNETIPVIYECKDNELNFQKITQFNSNPGWLWFEITSVYKGTSYSDTPLSELDFKFRKSGWFFCGE